MVKALMAQSIESRNSVAFARQSVLVFSNYRLVKDRLNVGGRLIVGEHLSQN